jgi:hypothetical protein
MSSSKDKKSPVADKQLRHAGQYLDDKIEIINLKRLRNFFMFLVIFAVALYEVLHAYFNLPLQPMLAFAAMIAMGVWVLCEDYKLKKEAKNYLQGSIGEKTVGEILDNLREKDLIVFHDIPMRIGEKTFNIDHVIVSKQGIYAIETKNISKNEGNPEITTDGKVIKIRGKASDNSAIIEASRHAKILFNELNENTGKRFYVKPVLVYPNWLVKDYVGDDLWVLNPKRIGIHIKLQRETLNDVDINIVKCCLSNLIKKQ